MSAQMLAENPQWVRVSPEPRAGKELSELAMESLFRNYEEKNLVAPLREVHLENQTARRAGTRFERKRLSALALQQQWEAWLVQRELLRSDIERGQEFLQQVRADLAVLRSRLEEWPEYERVCGKNPVLDYMRKIAAQERIEQFLPLWLKRRETQLQSLTQDLERFARKNGLKHML